jgi:hypothetical protein
LQLLFLGDLEIATREFAHGIRPCREHGKIIRIVELAVHGEREQSQQDIVTRDHDRHRRHRQVSAVAGEDQIDLVDVEQFCVDGGHERRIALIVIVDELHRPAEKASLGVDVLFPHLIRGEYSLAV